MKKIILTVVICCVALVTQTQLYAFVDPNAYHWEGQQQWGKGDALKYVS